MIKLTEEVTYITEDDGKKVYSTTLYIDNGTQKMPIHLIDWLKFFSYLMSLNVILHLTQHLRQEFWVHLQLFSQPLEPALVKHFSAMLDAISNR